MCRILQIDETAKGQMRAKPLFRALAIGWMALIFFLSSQPTLPVPFASVGGDKLAHVAVYAVLGFLVALSLFSEVLTWKQALLVTGLVTAYGITDEFHQAFVPGRQVSGWDVLADGFGGFLMPEKLIARVSRRVPD